MVCLPTLDDENEYDGDKAKDACHRDRKETIRKFFTGRRLRFDMFRIRHFDCSIRLGLTSQIGLTGRGQEEGSVYFSSDWICAMTSRIASSLGSVATMPIIAGP